MDFVTRMARAGASALQKGFLWGGPLVAGVEVSVLVSESHNLAASATKLSLESGAQVTDHVIVDPVDVSVVFAVSNAGSGSDNARDVLETFRRMLNERDLVELVTEHHVYANMVVVGLSPYHQAPYKGALNVTVRLQQINFVQLESVGREPQNLPTGTATEKTAAAPVNAGKQEAPDMNKSLAAKLADANEVQAQRRVRSSGKTTIDDDGNISHG